MPGGPLGHVLDLSGNGNHWTAFSDATRPTYQRASDGQYYALFDGVDDWGQATYSLAQPWSRMSLIRQETWNSSRRIFSGTSASTGELMQSGGTPILNIDANAIASANRHPGEDCVITEYFNSTSSYMRQDDFPARTGNGGTNASTGLRVGGRRTGASTTDFYGNFRWYGTVATEAEISAYDQAMFRKWFDDRRRSYANGTKVIVCTGDSLTAGTGSSGGAANFYPALLATELGSGWRTVNRGIPSQKSYNIGARTGGIPTTVSLASNALPASGSVNVTVLSPLSAAFPLSQAEAGPLALATVGTASATITTVLTTDDGTEVKGQFTRSDTNQYTFTRDIPGEPKVVSPGADLTVMQHGYDFYPSIFWPGRNNLGNANIDSIYDDRDAIIAGHHSSQWILIGLTNQRNGAEDTGSSILTAILAYNADSLADYGTRFFDAYAFLRDTGTGGGFDLMGLSPTAQDTTDIAAGRIPQTFHNADNLHFNNNGYGAIAKGLAARIGTLGW